jgi:hypothetical protein
VARDAAGGVALQKSEQGVSVVRAFRRGSGDSGLDGNRVWMACMCGAVINRSADDD